MSKLRGASWLPAGLLIFVQLAIGLRDQPQSAFFLLYMQEQLGLTPVMISSVVSAALLAGMTMALVGGAAAGRLGSKRVLLAGLGLSAVGSLALQASVPWLSAGLWLAGGAGLALQSVGGSSYMTRISRQGGLGVLAAFYALSVTAGGAAGNPLAGVLIERYGYSPYSWMIIAVSGVAILVVVLLMREEGVPASAAMRQPVERPAVLWLVGLAMLRQPNLRAVAALRCLPTIYYGMLLVLVPLLLNGLTGSKVLVAAYGMANLVLASAAQLAAGRAADRWGARAPTLAAFSILILSGFGLAAGVGSVQGLFIFGVLGIASAWALATLMFVWVNDGINRSEHPPAFGLLHAVWSLSMIGGSLLGGWFVTARPGLPFLLAGLLNVGALFLTMAYYKRLSSANLPGPRAPARNID